MAESYLLDQRRLLPCAAYLDGEYGYKDVYIGVPVIIGKNGVESIVELDLNAEEKVMFEQSAVAVQGIVNVVKSQAG
jgi:malate dehydrogenase